MQHSDSFEERKILFETRNDRRAKCLNMLKPSLTIEGERERKYMVQK